MMQIIAVCGLGFGSSLILKMTIQKALKAHGLEADVVHSDFGSAKSQKCDLYMVASDMAEAFREMGKNFVPVTSVYSVDEVSQALIPLVKKYYEEHPE